MNKSASVNKRRSSATRRWIRRAFLLWAVFAMGWLANSYRTQGVDAAVLQSSPTVAVVEGSETLEFMPSSPRGKTALVFICGAGVAAHAYAPLLHPIAEAGYPVFVVKLPYRFAPLESHKQAAVDRVRRVIADHPEFSHWVVSWHSLGGALTCRLASSAPLGVKAIVLIGTTHPKQDDLSALQMSATKIYASQDGVALAEQVLANKRLLPESSKWVEIKGGNHSQFGHYGYQLFDGTATVSRETQQQCTRSVLLDVITAAESQ